MKCWEMMLIVFITMGLIMQLTILAPFMPLEVKRRQIAQIFTGAIMGSSSIGILIVPVITTKFIIPKFGNRLSAQIGSLWLSISVFAYGLEYFIPDSQKTLFVVLSIITRVSEGSAVSVAAVSFFSMLTTQYPHERGKALSLKSLGIGGGLVGGLGLGGLSYQYLGYFGVFSIMSLIPFGNAILMLLIQQTQERGELANSNNIIQRQSKIYEKDVLKVRRTSLALLSIFIGQFFILFLDPILALKLSEDFSFTKPQISLFMMVFFCSRILSSLFSLCIPQRCDKRLVVITGNVFMLAGLILVGPSRILGIPNMFQIMEVGMALGGFGRSFQIAHGMGEAIEGSSKVYPEWEQRCSDLVNSIQLMAFGIAFFIGPLTSSALYEYMGFRSTIDFMGVISLVNLVIYLGVTVCDILGERRSKIHMQNQQLRESLLFIRAQNQ